MAGVTIGRRGNRLRGVRFSKREESPAIFESSLKTRGVLHVNLDCGEPCLHMSAGVDRHVAIGIADFQDQNRFIRPGPGFYKRLVRGRRREHVVESRIALRVRLAGGSIGHREPRAQENPFAIIRGQPHGAVARVLRILRAQDRHRGEQQGKYLHGFFAFFLRFSIVPRHVPAPQEHGVISVRSEKL